MADATGQFRYGGFWWRFLAYIIDGIILSIIGGVIGAIIGGVVGFSAGADPAAILTAQSIAFVVLLVLQWLYFAISESSSWRGTIGKRACGLLVVDEQGQRISFGRATGRYFAKFVSALILSIGFLMAGWNHKKRALHDMIAGTLVLKSSGAVATSEAVPLPA